MNRRFDGFSFPWPAKLLCLGLVYFIAARYSLLLAFAGSNASPVWPPAGLALAALALGGLRLWPAIILGAFAANLTAFLATGQSGLATYAVSASIACGNTVAALAGAALMRQMSGNASPLGNIPGSLRFLFIAALSALLSTTCGLASLRVGGIIDEAATSTIALTWWMGDLTGILIVTPLIMAWLRPQADCGSPGRLRQLPLALLAIALLAWLLFVAPLGTADSARPWLFLLIPALGATALRWGLRGAATANLIVAAFAIGGARYGIGLFSQNQLNDALIQCDLLLSLFSTLAVLISADLAERRLIGADNNLWQRTGWPWIGLLVGIIVTVLAWHLVARHNERQIEEAFAAQAESIHRQLGRRITDYQLTLRGASALFRIKDQVSRQDWREYFEAIAMQKLLPGVQGIGFALRLTPAELAAHTARIRGEGFPDYTVRPSGAREEYTSVIYIEPFDRRNRRAFGYDMFSEPLRNRAMSLARDSGQPATSGRITLMQEDDNQPQAGVLSYFPIYRRGLPTGTVAERRQALFGYVYMPFRMNDLIEGSLRQERRDIHLEIFDGDGNRPEQRLYSNLPLAAEERTPARQQVLHKTLDIGQHQWTLKFTTRPEFYATRTQHMPSLVLLSGILLSLALFVLVRTLSLTQRQAETMAARMSRAYTDAESRLNALIDSAGEAILVADQRGNVLSANPAAQKLFGHTPQDMAGIPLSQLFGESDLEPLRHTMEALRLAPGSQNHRLTLHGRLPGGQTFPVDLSLSHWISAGGEMFGLILRDISELQHAAEFMRGVFDEGADAMLVTTPDGGILRANHAACRLFGHTQEDFSRLSIEDLVPARFRRQHVKMRQHFSQGHEKRGMGSSRELLAQHADGHEFPVDITLNTLLLPSGRQIIATILDISERRRAEQRIHELLSLQTAILTSANFSIITTTPEGIIVSFNRAAERMLGYSAEEVIGKATPAILHDAGEIRQRAPQLSAELGKSIEPGFEVFVAKTRLGEVEEREWTYIRKDGSRFPVRLSVTPLHDEAGNISGFMGIASDITALKKTERTLRESEGMLRGLFELSPLGIALTDMRGGYIEFNKAFSDICGYPADELYALDYWTLTPREYEAAELEQLAKLDKFGRYGPYEKEYLRKDGSRIPIRLNGVKMTLQGHDYIWSIVEDISLQKSAEAAILDAKQAAESANRAKSDFLANMSHEIRTPLNAILGLTQLLLESELNDVQHDYLHKVHTSSQALLAILNDILDYSKIEAGRLDLERREFNLEHLLDTCASLFSVQAAHKNISLRFDLPPEIPRRVVGDSLRLSQILHNLVGNALKFTRYGSISVEIRQLALSSEGVRLQFAVHDTGIGIAADKLGQLFQAFTQADTSVTRKHGGTGLGLAISRRLVELMGGQITVESTPDKGSSFRFDVCLGLAGSAGETTGHQPDKGNYREQAQGIRGARLLVIEDNELNRTVARELLSRAGLSVSLAVDGFDALEQARGHRFDAILMDLQMPGIDGLETTRRLRQLPEHQQTPIIAMTAAAMQQDREQCLAAGMNDHVSKPIQPEELIQTLRRWVPERQGAQEMHVQPNTADAPSIERLIRLLPAIAVEEAIRRTGDNAALYVELLASFLANRQTLPATLCGEDAGSAAEIHALAHSLKGECANLGMRSVAAAADALAQSAKREDLAALPELRRQLADALAETLHQLAACDCLQTTTQPLPDRGQLRSLLAELQEHLLHNRLKGKRQAEEIASLLAGTALSAAFQPTLAAARRMNFKEAQQTLPAFLSALDREDS